MTFQNMEIVGNCAPRLSNVWSLPDWLLSVVTHTTETNELPRGRRRYIVNYENQELKS